jgi:kumamolisin
MLRLVRAIKFGAIVAATAMIPVVALAQADAQADQKSRTQELESKLLNTATPVGPVPNDDQVKVTLILKHAPPTGAATSQASDVERLTATQFANRFAASPETLAKIDAFAQANHLRIVESDPLKRRVVLSGTASAMASAFSTQLHFLSMANGQTYRSATTPPSLPADLAPDLEAVVGLNTRPLLSPRFVTSRAATAQTVYFNPTQVASLYNFPGDASGAGQTIAIIQFGGGFNQADLDAYFASLNLPSPKITVVSVDNATNSPGADADTEVALDIEMVGAVANGADITVYFADNNEQGFVNSILDAVHNQQQKPSVISISWGAAEDLWSQQGLTAFNSILQDAATLGITVIAASGDNGSSDGMNDKKLHVDFPASSPYVLAAGGTTFVIQNNAIVSEGVWNDSNGAATGGGVSLAFARPAYQNAAKVPPHPTTGFGGRGVPDVAGNADPKTGYRIHVKGADIVVGGTSAVAPLWAGLIARLNQKLGQRLGFINDKLYATSSQIFRDVTSGSNDVDGLGAYAATAGWNACTGLGTPDAAKILANVTVPAVKPPAAAQSTLLVAFGDTTDKVRSVYPVAGTSTNGCGTANPCVTLVAPSTGLTFFFNIGNNLLYEIRADAPFAGDIDGVHIGDLLNDVTARLGQPITQPFAFGDAEAYIFKSSGGVVRCDFDDAKKCRTIFVEQ